MIVLVHEDLEFWITCIWVKPQVCEGGEGGFNVTASDEFLAET